MGHSDPARGHLIKFGARVAMRAILDNEFELFLQQPSAQLPWRRVRKKVLLYFIEAAQAKNSGKENQMK